MASKQPPKHSVCSEDTFIAVCKAVEGGMTKSGACRLYGISRSTFNDKVNNKTPLGCSRGRKPVFTQDEESLFVKFVDDMAKQDNPVEMEELCDRIEMIVDEDKRITPFIKGRPGRRWKESFLRRHPETKDRLAKLQRGRAPLTKDDVMYWFDELKNHLEEIDALDLLQQPERIFNTDEVGIIFQSNMGKYLTLNKMPLKQLDAGKEQLVLQYSFSATGEMAPSLVVYKGQRKNSVIHRSVPEGFMAEHSVNGLVNSDIFLEYCKAFHSWLLSKGIQSHVLLLGRHTHCDINISKYCAKHKIVLFRYPPDTKHILQPANKGIFRHLKIALRKEMRGQTVNKVTFWTSFCKTMRTALCPELIQSVFQKCGMFPFDPNAVDYTKCANNSNKGGEDPTPNIPVPGLNHVLEKEDVASPASEDHGVLCTK